MDFEEFENYLEKIKAPWLMTEIKTGTQKEKELPSIFWNELGLEGQDKAAGNPGGF